MPFGTVNSVPFIDGLVLPISSFCLHFHNYCENTLTKFAQLTHRILLHLYFVSSDWEFTNPNRPEELHAT